VRAIATVAGVTLTALFAVGLGLSLFTGRNALRGALRMVLIGGGAGRGELPRRAGPRRRDRLTAHR